MELTYQVLVGIITAGVTTSESREPALTAVRRAAERGHGEVAEMARRFLSAVKSGR